MPLSYRQAGNLFVAGPNIKIYPSGNTYAISGSASGGGGSGTAVTGLTSAGTGNRLVFSTITSNNTVLVQKSISAGTGVAIIESSDGTLTFSATSAGGGIGNVITGATSAGTGTLLVLSGTVVNNSLVQKSFQQGSNISISESNGTLTINTTANGTIISGVSLGSASSVAIFSGVSSSNLVFRRIISGANIGVYLSGNDIVISGSSGAINGVTGITNLGGGSNVLSSVTSGVLYARTISGSNGIEAVESGSNILVRPVTTTTANRLFFAGTGGALTVDDEFQIDATNGTMTLGFTSSQNNVTSRLLIAGGSAAISQIRLTAFASGYTSTTTTGDIWYNSTSGNSLFFNKSANAPTPFIFKDNNYSLTGTTNARILQTNSSGTINTLVYLTNLGIFNALTSTTISGTSELNVFNTGTTFLIGTNILNSSTHGSTPQLISGKKFRFNARGTITTPSNSVGNLTVKMKLGSVVVATSTFSPTTSLSNYFEIDCTFTIRSQGSSGTVIGSGKMLAGDAYLGGLLGQIVQIGSSGTVTINTTVDTPFTFTIQNSTQPNNIYVINEATLEYLN